MGCARQPLLGVPDIVEERAGGTQQIVGAVSEHASVGQQHRMNWDQWPGPQGRPFALTGIRLCGFCEKKQPEQRQSKQKMTGNSPYYISIASFIHYF